MHSYMSALAAPALLHLTLYVRAENFTSETQKLIHVCIYWVFNALESRLHNWYIDLFNGQTLQDVYQAFCSTSDRLGSNDASRLSDIDTQLRQTYDGPAKVVHLKSLINWSSICAKERTFRYVQHFRSTETFRSAFMVLTNTHLH